MFIRRLVPALVLAGFLFLGSGVIAGAHGFGERYDLPVPLYLYLYGAAATVACSFGLIAIFVRRHESRFVYPTYNLFRHYRLSVILQSPLLKFSVKGASVGLFLLVVVAGFWGDQNPVVNPAPTLVWVIWWVGFSIVVPLLGNLWPLVNPWNGVYSAVEWMYWKLTGNPELSLGYTYPKILGLWPAFCLLFVFGWIENVYAEAGTPSRIATLALVYSVLTWAGMFTFGKRKWLLQVEFFTVFYRILGKFAPTEIRSVCSQDSFCGDRECSAAQSHCVNCIECFKRSSAVERSLNIRPYGAGLASGRMACWDEVIFVMFVLASVSFDGFEATSKWVDVQVLLFPVFDNLGGFTAISTFGLVIFPIAFLGVYLICSYGMALSSGTARSVSEMSRGFVYSLVPIALAYNIAHYLSYLLIQGQRVIPALSDPFALGWNLFGLADYQINIGVIGARPAWILAVVSIVLGHIIAVYVAHLLALRLINGRHMVLRSQYPMLVLMVLYTITSLWIVAQPLVVDS